MHDEPDPPRKFYGFKPNEFEAANEPPREPTPATPAPIAPDPGIVSVHDDRIDVRELARIATGDGPALGPNAVANRPNEVHAILRDNLDRANTAGLNDVSLRQRRSRRLRDYLIAVTLLNGPLGGAAWFFRREAITLVFILAVFVFFNIRFAWHVWAIMDDY
jgi:hypothetical protein